MRLILFLTIFSIIPGCTLTARPKDDVGFLNVTEIQQIVGCYKNLAEAESPNAKIYLTQYIWPKRVKLNKEVKIVRVVKRGDHTLIVIGENNNKVLYKEAFIEGKDFTLESGRITIRNRMIGSLAGEPGNPFIGIGHESVTIGLDNRGDGKLMSNGTFAGTAFIFIPVAGHASQSYRFRRVEKGCINR